MSKILTEMRKRFVNVDEVAQTLELAWVTGENVILWGEGGYGKTEMAEAFGEIIGEPAFVLPFGEGMDEDKIFGGVNSKLLIEEGKIEYLYKNSFANHKLAIFEEMFDAQTSALLTLKHPLQKKVCVNGNQNFPMKTQMIIVCTNKSKTEIAEDATSRALTERFLFEVEVKWPNHRAEDYSAMFIKVLGEDSRELAYIIEKCNQYQIISPRTAMKAYKAFSAAGIDGLMNISGFNKDFLEQMREDLKGIIIAGEQRSQLLNIAKKIEYETIRGSDSLVDTMVKVKYLQQIVNNLDRNQYHDDVIELYRGVRTSANEIMKKFKNQALEKTNLNSEYSKKIREIYEK